MTSCFTWLIFLAGAILVMVSIIRWFEQVTDAVDGAFWSRVALLVAAPFTVWFFESKVSAGRPTAVPHHEPVQGFGVGPVMPTDTPRPKPAAKKRSPVDPEAIAKLKQKMREQGMLDDDSGS
ncbi:MAG TPA: hypothetical protein VH518_22320 [Tepidisphaeraceae bacterium]|jgi:hypothetical protein